MKKVHTAVVLASALGGLLLAPLAVMANAHGLGFGAHPIHFRGHFGPAHRNAAYGQWPLYGGVVAVARDASDNTSDNTIVYATPEEVAFVPEPSRMLSCHHSQQIVTVPSEQGGTRQITITRC